MIDELPHPNIFEKLTATHDRLRTELSKLAAAASSLATDHDDPTAIGAIRGSIDYFERSLSRHEADEERSLFPRLSHLPELARIIDALEQEHAVQRMLHDELRDLVPEGGTPDRAAVARIGEIARSLGQSYAAHLAREEHDLFPGAARTLDPDAHTAIAHEMDERRGRSGGGGGGRGGGGGGGGGRGRG